MKNLKSFRTWVHGLGAAFITGASTAALTGMAMPAAKAMGVDVPVLNWKALGVMMLAGGLPGAFAYLKQSPLPKIEDEDPTAPGNPS